MTPLLFALMISTSASLLDIQTLPWHKDDSSVVVADFDLDGRAEVGVISDNRLDVYEQRRNEPSFSVFLPENTAIIDVFKSGEDGATDIIAVAGEDIVRIPVVHGTPAPPELCFTRRNQYSQYGGLPFPGVLMIKKDRVALVALPCADALELWTLDGKMVESYSIGVDAPRRLSLGKPFSVLANQRAQLAEEPALEYRVSSVSTYKPMLPGNDLPLAIDEPSGRLGTPRQQREASTLGPERWPWFPLNKTGTTQVRALYARSDSTSGHTAIRIREIPEATTQPISGMDTDHTGPIRHYPGFLLRHPDQLPDFNGDGFHDLLLWKAPDVSPTANSLARAIAKGTWPVRIISHAYAPDSKRFQAKPLGYIEIEIPIAAYIASGGENPLGTVFLEDANGDGLSDFGCFLDARTIAIWLSGDSGFSRTPEFRHEFSDPIEEVLFELDLDGQGRSTIALRSQHRIYLLRPDTAFEFSK